MVLGGKGDVGSCQASNLAGHYVIDALAQDDRSRILFVATGSSDDRSCDYAVESALILPPDIFAITWKGGDNLAAETEGISGAEEYTVMRADARFARISRSLPESDQNSIDASWMVAGSSVAITDFKTGSSAIMAAVRCNVASCCFWS